MVKFYKPGRVVVILNGRQAGKKGIIVKSNFENTKDRKYPHCLVVGLSKTSRRVTKNFLKKNNEKLQRIEALLADPKKKDKAQERINRLKRLGVFIRPYNMTHLLATRYKIEEDFKINSAITTLDNVEKDIKEKTTEVNKLVGEHKNDDASKKNVEEAKKQLTGLRDQYRNTLKEVKAQIGTELYNRFYKGFVREKNASPEEVERIAHTEFLFKKLKF